MDTMKVDQLDATAARIAVDPNHHLADIIVEHGKKLAPFLDALVTDAQAAGLVADPTKWLRLSLVFHAPGIVVGGTTFVLSPASCELAAEVNEDIPEVA